jgi:hypothetical protein
MSGLKISGLSAPYGLRPARAAVPAAWNEPKSARPGSSARTVMILKAARKINTAQA